MKKLLLILLAHVLCVSLCACGKKESSESSDKSTTETLTESIDPEIQTFNVGETVSTDIVDFTLEKSKFSYYLINNDVAFVEPTDEPNGFSSSIGECYVSMTITIKNRSHASINFTSSFGDWDPAEWSVTYSGEDYELYALRPGFPDTKVFSLTYAALKDNSTGKFERYHVSNLIIYGGETYTLRFAGIININPTSLKDGFELNVKVPNSKGEFENFKFNVPAIS